MKKYLLVCTDNPRPSRSNLKVVHMSNDFKELKKIWQKINNFNLEIEKSIAGNGNSSKKALKMIENNNYLNGIYGTFNGAVIWTVKIIGIFKSVDTDYS
jgi:hypothetical protein